HYETGNDYNPGIIYHFTAGQWIDMSPHKGKAGLPNGATLFYQYLTGVATVGPNEMWAVGYETCFGCPPSQVGPVVVYCTPLGCTSAIVVDSDTSARLYGVAVAGPEDVWAVGITGSGGSLIE